MDDIDSLPPIERMVDLNEARVFRIRGVVNHVLADFRNPAPASTNVISHAPTNSRPTWPPLPLNAPWKTPN